MSEPNPSFTWEDVQKAIEDAVAKTTAELQSKHDTEMETLRASLQGAAVTSPIPEHSGGPGLKVAPTWSLAEQEASRAAAFAKTALELAEHL
jgi:hypothetical protein